MGDMHPKLYQLVKVGCDSDATPRVLVDTVPLGWLGNPAIVQVIKHAPPERPELFGHKIWDLPGIGDPRSPHLTFIDAIVRAIKHAPPELPRLSFINTHPSHSLGDGKYLP